MVAINEEAKMRETKYRGWHVTQKKMFSCEQMVSDQLTMLTDGRFINVSGSSTSQSIIYPRDKFIPLQYTGLKDKTGKEIYVGDIVTMHQFLFEGVEVEKQIGGVIGLMEYGLSLKQIRNEFIEEYCGYDTGKCELYLNEFYGLHEESWEIIGNIYENPELLEAQS